MEKIKIGILTWYYYPNPGTAFQAYALQHFINSVHRCRAEILNINSIRSAFLAPINSYYANHYGVMSLSIRILLGIKSYIYCSFQRRNIKKWPAKTIEWNDYDYLSINNRYDWIILGSDQLWNLNVRGSHDFDRKLFLDFVKGPRKGAYGPSTGNDVWPEEFREEIKDLLSDFSFIGVREMLAVNMVQELTKIPVHWSLDPTFLLDKTDWSKIAKLPNEKKEFIFEYCIIKSPLLRAVTEKLSEITGLPIIESHGDLRKHVPSAKRMPHPSADTWLGYLMSAKYIVTDSFHGCAFSINTNKDFYTITTINEARIHSLLELFGLQNRMLKNCDEIGMPKAIDWDSVNVRLEYLRKESQDWLRTSLMKG